MEVLLGFIGFALFPVALLRIVWPGRSSRKVAFFIPFTIGWAFLTVALLFHDPVAQALDHAEELAKALAAEAPPALKLPSGLPTGAAVGLGLSLDGATQAFAERYRFEPAGDAFGQKRWMARDKAGVVELVGPDGNLSTLSVAVAVLKKQSADNARRMGDLMTALRTVFPQWPGAARWLAEQVPNLALGPVSTTRDGLGLRLSYLPAVAAVMLTIDSTGRPELAAR